MQGCIVNSISKHKPTLQLSPYFQVLTSSLSNLYFKLATLPRIWPWAETFPTALAEPTLASLTSELGVAQARSSPTLRRIVDRTGSCHPQPKSQ
jgi:hypothetical protein